MAQYSKADGGKHDDESCRTAKELLVDVKAELARFDAKKLTELKTELEAFVNAQDGLVAEYRTKFPLLRKLWCERQLDVERLCAHIRCEFPPKDDKWKTLIEDCICTKLRDLCCLEQRVNARKVCCGGPLERARDAAADAFARADARLQTLKTLAKSIETALTADKALVDRIEKLAPTERVGALWLFWFKLLPEHKRLAPYDASPECLKVCGEWEEEVLCKDIYAEPCAPDDGGCSDGKSTGDCRSRPVPEGPSLISPDGYRHALDCAWRDYIEAKTVLAQAQADFSKAPDDLASLVASLKAKNGTIGDEIMTCLNEYKPQDDCCKPADATKSGA